MRLAAGLAALLALVPLAAVTAESTEMAWAQDCDHDSYAGAPANGSAWESGECARRVARGGAWNVAPKYLRSAYRISESSGYRHNYVGFRVARSRKVRNTYQWRRRWILCSLVPALFIAATMTSYAHDDVEQLIEGLGNRVARAADFDVYLSEDRLTYVTRNCGQVDLAAKFFLRVFPVHRDDLPEDSKQHGFDNLKFRFHEFNGVIDGEVCTVTRELPKYAIAMIRTGQFTGEGQVWEVVFRPGTSHYIAHLLEELVDVEQLIEGLGYFDVYLSEDRLAYVTEDCDQVDLAAKFVLHVIPVHWDDLPEHRKQHGFDNFDFSFYTDGVTDGEVCAVTQELPKYAIAKVRTGQHIPGGSKIWRVEFSLSNVEVERLIEGLGDPMVRTGQHIPGESIMREVESSQSNVEVDMSNIQSIPFQETPNLYFISFDALAPRALLRNYLGIENTRFHDLFDDEFRRFPNFFVNAVRTFYSINMLMSLDEDLFFSIIGGMNNHKANLFSGALPSPLLRILSENGYETSALYNDTYFGYPKGPHIDNYFVNRVDTDIDFDFDAVNGVRQGGVCTVTRELPDYDLAEIRTGQYVPGEDPIWTVKFFPARLKGDPVVVRSDFDMYLDEGRLVYVKRPCEQEDVAPRFFLQVIPKELHRGEFLLDKLTKLASDRPQFLIAHLYMPGHAASYFRYDDQDHLDQFKSSYTRESNSAARYLEDIVAHLKQHDPNAILLVYGDHGPLVSRGMRFDEAPEMVVQDRFGVLGGVYPRDRCSAYFDAAEEQGYLTVLDAVHAILGCLSGGQSVLVRPRQNRLGGFGGVPLDSGYTYEDFLYE